MDFPSSLGFYESDATFQGWVTSINSICDVCNREKLKKTLLQKWHAVHYLKSLWDLKSEISSLHFTNFIIISLRKHHVSLLINIIHYYNLL
jgi:hypothetical protein